LENLTIFLKIGADFPVFKMCPNIFERIFPKLWAYGPNFRNVPKIEKISKILGLCPSFQNVSKRLEKIYKKFGACDLSFQNVPIIL
jgi:hypothetical protein